MEPKLCNLFLVSGFYSSEHYRITFWKANEDPQTHGRSLMTRSTVTSDLQVGWRKGLKSWLPASPSESPTGGSIH